MDGGPNQGGGGGVVAFVPNTWPSHKEAGKTENLENEPCRKDGTAVRWWHRFRLEFANRCGHVVLSQLLTHSFFFSVPLPFVLPFVDYYRCSAAFTS